MRANRKNASNHVPRLSQGHRLAFEHLQPRRLLVASHMIEGVLVVTGTSGPNDITLAYDPILESARVVSSGELLAIQSVHSLEGIEVYGLAGDDQVHIDLELMAHVFVNGGEGQDTLSGVSHLHDISNHLAHLQRFDFGNRSGTAIEVFDDDTDGGLTDRASGFSGSLLPFSTTGAHVHSSPALDGSFNTIGSVLVQASSQINGGHGQGHLAESAASESNSAAHPAIHSSEALSDGETHASQSMDSHVPANETKASETERLPEGEAIAVAEYHSSAAMTDMSVFPEDMEMILAGWTGEFDASILDLAIGLAMLEATPAETPGSAAVESGADETVEDEEEAIQSTVSLKSMNPEVALDLVSPVVYIVKPPFETSDSEDTQTKVNTSGFRWSIAVAAGIALTSSGAAFLLESRAARQSQFPA